MIRINRNNLNLIDYGKWKTLIRIKDITPASLITQFQVTNDIVLSKVVSFIIWVSFFHYGKMKN